MKEQTKGTTKSKVRNILVTSALPYANGPIHLGHLVEYIQTDIWVRAMKMEGHRLFYFCADDTHGTPIMLAARKENITPESLVERIQKEHYRDLTSFSVDFDNYYSTNSPENRKLSELVYNRSKERGYIDRRAVRQLYCEHDKMFLPDRFVRGECPKCGARDQYGDSCEVCGTTYSPQELKNPSCAICKNIPVIKESEHLFFKLQSFTNFLKEWLNREGRVDAGVRKKMFEWLDAGLKDWDISRDGPYFGFLIPDEKDKYFYVWLDAPIGYMASSKNYFDSKQQSDLFSAFWNGKEGYEIHHFIGKDIIYFHTLFWPAVLKASDFHTPDAVHVHGFLTINGEKMSKSRGTFVRASNYLKHLDPQALRYYYASRLNGSLDDLDLSTDDFIKRYNSDVVGNLTNIFSRLCAGLGQKLNLTLADKITQEGELLRKHIMDAAPMIRKAYEERNYAKSIREIAMLGDEINRFITEREPWKIIKTDIEKARSVVTDALEAGRLVAALIKPVLPIFASAIEELLALTEPMTFNNMDFRLPANHKIREYRHLSARLENKNWDEMMKDELQTNTNSEPKEKSETPEGIIGIEELHKVELKVAFIVNAEDVQGADKLVRLELDIGEAKTRQVFARIKAAYKPQELKGMSVVCVSNLAPRKMRFGISEGMILAAGEDEKLTLVVPHRDAKAGERLR